jgi:hypothetical protein
MNNQVKLIDTEKTLEWFIQHLDPFHVERFREAINRGILAPDTPPVPTIKPGDKVRHKEREMKNGMVILVSQNGEYVDVSWTGISSVTYPITELEVMK